MLRMRIATRDPSKTWQGNAPIVRGVSGLLGVILRLDHSETVLDHIAELGLVAP